jgi:RNA polymerase sigma factor (sigma-70 family)
MVSCRPCEKDSHPDPILPDEEISRLPDGQLLERYVLRNHHGAFAALVHRYGTLVLGVCERVLQDRHDAEDAFQATFLVLARKASRLHRRGTLSSWLYSVAFRTALKARGIAARRRAHERKAASMPAAQHSDEQAWAELRPLFDEELNHLPHKYRAPLVLCFLEGKTHLQAARELGWSSGSMSRRIDRGRELLRQRLTKRGVALPAVLLCTLLTERARASIVTYSLEQSTVRAAIIYGSTGTATAGLLSRDAAALAEQVVRSGTSTTMKVLYAVGAVAILAIGAGAAIQINTQGSGLRATRNLASGSSSCGSPVAAADSNAGMLAPVGTIRSTGPIQALALTNDGKLLASACRTPNHPIRIFDRKSGEECFKITGQFGSILTLTFTPDGMTLAAAGEDGVIRLWQMTSGAELTALRGHQGSIPVVRFSPDGRALFSGGVDGTIRVWQAAGWRESAVLRTSPVIALAMAPDGGMLASGGRDGTAHLWETSTRKTAGSLKVHGGAITALTFMDGRTLAVATSNQTIGAWEIPERRELDKYTGHSSLITGLAFLEPSGPMVSASLDGDVRTWQPGQPLLGRVLGQNTAAIRALAHARGWVAAGYDDGRIGVFQLENQSVTTK